MATEPRPAFIALGSNIAPEENLPRAVELLSEQFGPLACSSVWQSAPVGDTNQPDFCNAAVLVETTLSPLEIRTQLRSVEDQLGRVRDPNNVNAARTIDLDLVLLGDVIFDEPPVLLPDPDIPHRPFLIIPLAEIGADFMHPVLQCTLAELAAKCDTNGLTRRGDIALAGSVAP
ncbi:MAG: 2-amino-4-hydroxy-6-hydroxymethyldihydropteridine diphosphokinase [Planctomycetaceae bacterium]|nr:2-amino-4-hydroxy-6-hydroxymethyldihydropteridine diphosphokinase [Planctomycetaceae bacterium]